jgi:hypothetical protein
LDTVKGYSFSTPVVEGYCLSTPAVAGKDFAVNGPNDKRLEWEAIDWRVHEANVVRLRRRIFTATREQDWAAVRSLQKLTAPRGALSYPRYSREELEGRFLGLMAYLDPKR